MWKFYYTYNIVGRHFKKIQHMKKLELISLMILIFISTNIFAISEYDVGDTLYVWAKKGLQLRSEPSFNSASNTLIEYGEKVVVLDEKSIYASRILKKGIRSIELITDKDEKGETFHFELNGVPVFMKGANYIPQHSLQTAVTKKQRKQRNNHTPKERKKHIA